jgi:hypothetical protein
MIVAVEDYTRAPRLLSCRRQKRENGNKKGASSVSVGAALPDVRATGARGFSLSV